MRNLICIMLIIVGVIHLLPVTGIFGAQKLNALYGLDFSDPNLLILMRHRALLFSLLGAYLLYAAFQPTQQPLALIGAWLSVLSFLYFAWSTGGFNIAIARVVWADVLAAGCLLVATLARLRLYFRHRALVVCVQTWELP
jgi:hypothetical protein